MSSGEIEKRVLGKSGLEITRIGLGLWPIGGDGFGHIDDNIQAAFLPTLTEKEMGVINSVSPSCGGRKIWPA